MPKHTGGIYKSSVAKTVPADGSGCPLVPDKTNVQEWFEALCESVGISASPGYAFGREGRHNAGTWLIAAETQSNKRGLPFGLSNGKVQKVTISTRNIPAAFTVQVWYHDGNLSGATLVGSVTTTATSSTEDFPVNWAIPKGHQLAVKISAVGNPKPKETGAFIVVKGEAN